MRMRIIASAYAGAQEPFKGMPAGHWLNRLPHSSVPALMTPHDWEHLTQTFFPVLGTPRFRPLVDKADQGDVMKKARNLLATMNALPLYQSARYEPQIRTKWREFLCITGQSAYSYREMIIQKIAEWKLCNDPIIMKAKGGDPAHGVILDRLTLEILVLLKAALFAIDGREGKSET